MVSPRQQFFSNSKKTNHENNKKNCYKYFILRFHLFWWNRVRGVCLIWIYRVDFNPDPISRQEPWRAGDEHLRTGCRPIWDSVAISNLAVAVRYCYGNRVRDCVGNIYLVLSPGKVNITSTSVGVQEKNLVSPRFFSF